MNFFNNKKETRHPACSASDCANMAKRRNWRLKRIELLPSASSPSAILKVDCVFEGDCQFCNNNSEEE